MKCTNCGSDRIKESFTSYYRKVGSSYFIIENVPCKVCEQCGEVFFSLKDIDIIDRLIQQKLQDNVKINLFDFKIAA